MNDFCFYVEEKMCIFLNEHSKYFEPGLVFGKQNKILYATNFINFLSLFSASIPTKVKNSFCHLPYTSTQPTSESFLEKFNLQFLYPPTKNY
jgi:hypothetical protein